MTDWVSISALATAGSTILLAGATFSSVRAASRAAAAAERSLLVGLRPLLTSSRLDDRVEKIMWIDEHWAKVEGGHGYAVVTEGGIYLAISIRNVGQGLGVLQGWHVTPAQLLGADAHAEIPDFRRQSRDLYIPANDTGYWHAAVRDVDDPSYEQLAKVIADREAFTVDLLYSDHEGGQRIISRFSMRPRGGDGDWGTAVSRHWNLDRPDPR